MWNAERDDYFVLHLNLHKLFFVNRVEIALQSRNATSLQIYRVSENAVAGNLVAQTWRLVGSGTVVGAGELSFDGGYEGFSAVKVQMHNATALTSVRFLTVQVPHCVSDGAFVRVGEKRRFACENGRPGVVEQTCVQRGDRVEWNETTSHCRRE